MRTSWLVVLALCAVLLPSIDVHAQAAPAAAHPAQPAAQPTPPAADKAAEPVAAPPSQPACVPGQQIECACSGGVLGVQVCTDDGARFAPCVCQATESAPPPIAPAPPPYPVYQPYGAPPDYAPPPPPAEMRPMKRRSKGAMITGIVFLAVGGAATITGVAMLLVGTCAGEDGGSRFDTCHEDEELTRSGAVVTGIGGAMLLAGIIMTPIGAGKVPDDSAQASVPHVDFVAGPTFTGLRGSF
jgi:hypothetical protein